MEFRFWTAIRHGWTYGLRLFILSLLIWGWAMGSNPAQAQSSKFKLGDRVPIDQVNQITDANRISLSTRGVGKSQLRLPAIREQIGSTQILEIMNTDNEVFLIQIKSPDRLPPKCSDYMGQYNQLPQTQIQKIPLRAKRTIYQSGNKIVECRLFGQSGEFSGEIISYDKVPVQLQEE